MGAGVWDALEPLGNARPPPEELLDDEPLELEELLFAPAATAALAGVLPGTTLIPAVV